MIKELGLELLIGRLHSHLRLRKSHKQTGVADFNLALGSNFVVLQVSFCPRAICQWSGHRKRKSKLYHVTFTLVSLNCQARGALVIAYPMYIDIFKSSFQSSKQNLKLARLRVEFLLKTDSGYPKDAEDSLFTLANPGNSLRFNTLG